jgi:putative hemolysin
MNYLPNQVSPLNILSQTFSSELQRKVLKTIRIHYRKLIERYNYSQRREITVDGIFLEIMIVLALILVNGVFAMSEIAVVSSRKVRLQQQAEAGSSGARAALALANEPGRFLSTVQIGITLVGIFTGAFGGATIAGSLQESLAQYPAIASYSGTLSVGIVVLITTYLSLVIGELAPKQIALNNPERISSLIAPPMSVLSKLTSPLVKLLSVSTTVVLKLLRIGNQEESTVTEEEVRILISQGREHGIFEPIEEEMVEQVFRLSDQSVSALLTPRPEIIWIDTEDSNAVNQEKIISNGHSLLPVAKGSLDEVQGYVRAVDLLTQVLQNHPLTFQSVLRPAIFVPESLPAFKVLDLFKAKGEQMAFVIDEYGGLQGLVTHQDVLEAIIGNIHEPQDAHDPDIFQREDGSWLIDGMVSIDEFKDLFDLKLLPGEESNMFQTVGGFVITFLGRIPSGGDQFDLPELKVEVIDMDGNRVDKVMVIVRK